MTFTLAIETSCDETSIAIIKGKNTILATLISSQINVHRKYGGVVPEVASRLHAEVIHDLINNALSQAQLKLKDLTAIAVTIGPGLEGCLLVGITVAKTLAAVLDIPLIPVNHIHGHIFAYTQYEQTLDFPTMALIISGGHTDLIMLPKPYCFEKVGKTRDDAAGEAFDKVARQLGLGYPGGPIIEKLAATGNPKAFKLPLAMKHIPFEFSFSGLKTAMMDCIASLDNIEEHVHDLCASFQATVIETICYKTIEACHLKAVKQLIVAGGVAANQTLIKALKERCNSNNIHCITIEPKLCTDNAAMIGLAATHLGNIYKLSATEISAKPQFSYAI